MVSVVDAINLAINFGVFTLTLIGVVVAILTLIKKK
ncbi:putative holin-like toxin (plasmid) [Brevibacillus laterosporus]|uniref:Putative holin-like toxin n=1 Tax=Brevibacillus laterosporus TaxID=1465 RepID=A0A518V225_BRELA|nr:putative holin-like toxin [Brevibacillus laterosporus]